MLDYLIMYEVNVREFESIILLGNELKSRGYTVDYLGFEDCKRGDYVKNLRRIKKYFNKVKTVLMPSLYHDKELFSIVYYVCGKCTNVVNIRWEQYFTNANMVNTDGYLFPHGDAKKAYHMCWGQRSYDSLVAAGIDRSKLLLTGPLHMDLLREELSSYYFTKEEIYAKYQIPADKKTVLYISSFVGATMTDHQYSSQEKDFDGKYKKNMDSVTFQRRSYEETLNWIGSFLESHPEAFFIYRPHPAENITPLIKDLQDRYESFKIISDHSVKQWIKTCDVVTTWVSTSIVEAFFANKPCFIVRPFPYEEQNDMCVYENASFITTKEGFMSILDTEAAFSVDADVMRRHYDVHPQIPSYVRLCDELEKLKDAEPFPWDEAQVKEFESGRFGLFMKSIAYQCYKLLLRFLCFLHKITKLSFGKYWKPRIQTYLVKQAKKKYEKLNNEAFPAIYGRLTPVWEKTKK